MPCSGKLPVRRFEASLLTFTADDDYTDDDYNWGTNQYSSPLSAPSSPTPYGSDDDVNVIRVDSKVEDVKPAESADGKLGT